MGVVKPNLEVSDIASPQFKMVLDEIWEEVKQQMRDLPDGDLRS